MNRGQVFTFEELTKIPGNECDRYLEFTVNRIGYPLQDSHVTDEQLLSIPDFAQTQWKFIVETREMVSVFHYVSETDILEFVERQVWGVGTSFEEIVYTPKGFPREDPWKNDL